MSEENELNSIVTPEALISHYGRDQAYKAAAQLAGYVDVPPTITEFIEEDEFCGRFLGKGRLYPTWKEYLEYIFQDPFTCKFKEIAVTGSIGSGKALTLDSKIQTPYGEISMRDVRVGTLVCSPDGSSTTVKGVYPQGKEKVYKITFQDGSVVRCSGEHLWTGWWTMRDKKRRWTILNNGILTEKCQTLSLNEIIETQKKYSSGKTSHYFAIPLTQPVNFRVAKSPSIDPYMIGLWLGDGSSSVTKGRFLDIGITTTDDQILEYLESNFEGAVISDKRNSVKCYRFTGQFRGKFSKWLSSFDLNSCGAKGKRIPEHMQFMSVEDRFSLLQGLMDSDGYVCEKGGLYFTSISEQLIKDVRRLIQGLGGWANYSRKPAGYKKSTGEFVQCNDAHNLYIQLPDKSKAFRLERKLVRTIGANWSDKGGRPNSQLFRKMISIEEDGFEETQCIRVDHPLSLYLCDEFIVTHNTTFCATGAAYDLCKLLYLANPQEMFGLLKTKPIVLACINTTRALAQAALYNTLMEWCDESPFFFGQQSLVVQKDKRKKRDLFPHKINIMNASQGRQVLGLDVFGAVLSELNFQGAHVKDQAVQNYTQVLHRLETRFERGNGLITPGRLWLDSSKSDETGWLEQHMKAIQNDPESLIICKPIWEIKERAGTREYSGQKFKVFIGDQNRDPMILEGPQSTIGIPSELIINVPVEYRIKFERSLIGSIQNLGGYSTWGSAKFLSHERLVKACVETDGLPRQNPCYKEVISLDFDDDSEQIIQYIDLDSIPTDIPYYMHFDIGVKRDRTGIALTRCLGEVAVDLPPDEESLINRMTRDFLYETVLVLAIQAKPGKEVPLSKLRNFIVHLQDRGVPVVAVSADGYQSTELLQQAKKLGLLSDLVSVEKRDPYDYLKDCILERRWKGPAHPILVKELLELRDEGKKIDHPVVGSSGTDDMPSKDISDAVAGSVYNCRQRAISQKTDSAYSFYAEELAKAKRHASISDRMKQLGIKRQGRGWMR